MQKQKPQKEELPNLNFAKLMAQSRNEKKQQMLASEQKPNIEQIQRVEKMKYDQMVLSAKYMQELLEYYHKNVRATHDGKEFVDRVELNKVQYSSLRRIKEHVEAWFARRSEYSQLSLDRVDEQTESKREQSVKNLHYWDEYREAKFLLVKNYAQILKQHKRVRMMRLFILNSKMVQNTVLLMDSEKKRRRVALRSLFIAIRFYCNYKFKFKMPNGIDMSFRQKNLIRRHLTIFGNTTFVCSFENRAKRIVKDFLANIYPMVIMNTNSEKLTRAVKFIQQMRQRAMVTRLYRKKFLNRVFDREVRFLTEFFNNCKKPKMGKQTKAIAKCIRKIDRTKFHIYVSIYQRKCVADYMIQTREHEIVRLATRIQLNQLFLRHRKLIRDLEVEEPSAELNFNTQILDPDQFKTSYQIQQLQRAIENDQQLLGINKRKLEVYQKEAANLENELYKGPGGAIMEQYQTPKYSFEKYEEKVNSEMNRLQSMIMAKLREKIRDALL